MLARIMVMIALLVFASTALGYGGSLGTSTTLDRIGSDENVTVTAADTFVTQVVWNKSGSRITGATVDIKNTDTSAHTFEICVISKAGASISDTVGTSADCASTGSIASSATGSATINFSNSLNANSSDDTDISIEQTA